ncbi:MAG: NAD(P)-dependent oxidoreductase [Azospirillaceae bacterium]
MSAAPPPSGRLRVHFENLTSKPPVFHLTPERVAAARARHPAVDARLDVSQSADLETLPSALDTVEVLVTSYDVITHPRFPRDRLATAAPRLRWVFVTSAGVEKLLPLDWLPPGAALVNASGAHADKAREGTLMLLLMAHARVPRIAANQRARHWHSLFTPGIAGRTLVVAGVGDIGGAFAESGRSLGMRVLGVRRSGAPHPAVETMVTPDRLAELLPQADILVSALPLTAATRHLIDADALARLPEGASLISAGRAGVVDMAAARAALAEGRLAGMIADVFDPEPLPPEAPEWETPDLVVMPHVCMDDIDRFLPACLDIVFDNLARTLDGRPLANVVDPAAGY